MNMKDLWTAFIRKYNNLQVMREIPYTQWFDSKAKHCISAVRQPSRSPDKEMTFCEYLPNCY